MATLATNQNKIGDIGNRITQQAATPMQMLTIYDARIPKFLQNGIQSSAEIEPKSRLVAWHIKISTREKDSGLTNMYQMHSHHQESNQHWKNRCKHCTQR
jgi:hypothetical protein